jgi:hypothetical protein
MDLKQSRVTQVVNDVQIISAGQQTQKPAVVNDLFSMPDVLRTGAASRAELVAQDQTVTRVGANTIFSFDPGNRTIDLQQGSLLFHTPHGQGGGTIHTGSATASVLGTTLIVTTTPNGGFKVLALEGEVEVKFLNGLKQKLDPGQMTFILPGANQLAPVVIFRLDELIQNSLLVKGFAQTLQSWPQILNAVEVQNKLLHSGRLTDTGLYAGNNATPNQVEVLDVNTISASQQTQSHSPPANPPPPAPDLGTAEGADATINQPSLTDATIPTPPVHIFTSPSFTLADNNYFAGRTFSGFVARNIFVNTLAAPPEITSPLLAVNLDPYAGLATFDLVAVNNFSIAGPVVFNGLPDTSTLELIAGNAFSLAPGITITTGVQNLLLASPASLDLDGVGLYNPVKNLTLNSAGGVSCENNAQINAAGALTISAGNDISATSSQLTAGTALLTSLNGTIDFNSATLSTASHTIFIAPTAINLNLATLNSDFVALSGTASATISLNNSTINAPNSIVIATADDLNVTGTTIAPGIRQKQMAADGSALNSDPNSGSVTLSSTYGSVNVSGTSISTHYLTLNSGDGILLDGTGHTLTATGSGAAAKFTAVNSITVRNADFSSFALLNMVAKTILLTGDALPLISNFGTQTGQVNVNGPEIYGGLNLINCAWQNTPITSAGQVTLSTGPGNTPGIYSYAK